MTIQYINRAAPFALDPAVALLGNEREGLAIDFARDRAYNRDRVTAANNYLGSAASKFPVSRASDGTYFDASRVLQTAGPNVLRLTHDPVTGKALGARLEGSATNLLAWSGDISQTAWSKIAATVAPNAAIAPDGSMSMGKLVEDTSFNSHGVGQNAVVTTGLSYAISAVIAPAERKWAFLIASGPAFGNGAAGVAACNLLTGEMFTRAGSPTNLKSEWCPAANAYRFSMTAIASTTGSGGPSVYAAQDGNWANRNYAGDGVSGVYVGNLQLKAGSFATSYIKTTTAAAQRLADSLSFARAGTPEGTVVIRGRTAPGIDATQYLWQWDDGTAVNRFYLVRLTNRKLQFIVQLASTPVVTLNISDTIVADNTDFAVGATFKVGRFEASLNGEPAAVNSAYTGSLPTVSRVLIGSSHAGQNWGGTVASHRQVPRYTALPGTLL